MKKLLLSILFLITLSPSLNAFESGFEQKLQQLFEKYSVPGAAVSIIDGSSSEFYCLGYADIAKKNPIIPYTVFSLGSISKPISAIGILMLLKEKRIPLNAPIEELFQINHYNLHNLSVEKLLNHTSGLKYQVSKGIPIDKIKPSISIEEMAQKALYRRNYHDEKFLYSANGFILIQLLIESLSHSTTDQFIKENLFSPMRMNNSSFLWDSSCNNAKGYSLYGTEFPSCNYIEKCAAGLHSNLIDMTCFVQGFWNGKIRNLIGDFFFENVLQTNSNEYTLGFGNQNIEGLVFLSHHGTNRGWNTYFGFFPSLEKGIVILTNSDRGFLFIDELEEFWKIKICNLHLKRSFLFVDFAILVLAIPAVFLIWRTKNPPFKSLYKKTWFFPLVLLSTLAWIFLFYTPLSLYPGFIIVAYLPLRFHLITMLVMLCSLLLIVNYRKLHIKKKASGK